LRYAHQSFELTCVLPNGHLGQESLQQLVAGFHREHRRLYTYDLPNAPVELVNLRVTAVGILPKLQAPTLTASSRDLGGALVGKRRVYFEGMTNFVETPCYARDRLVPGMVFEGPALVDQDDTTTVVFPTFRTRVDTVGNLILERRPQ
jgi:N-methylhydantoinase A